MPLSRPDEQPLPSRRALRAAERAAEHAARRSAERTDAVRSRTRAPRVTDVPVVPPVAPPVERVLADHVLEGGDDVWVDDITPRPTPVASRAGTPAPAVPAPRAGGSAWRRLPQVLVVGSLVAATAGYAVTADVAATAGSVPTFVREDADVVTAQPAQESLLADIDAGSSLVAGEDGLLRVADDGQASRSGERSLLPGCDGVPPETEQPNGRMDGEFLCTLWDGKSEIRADAAVSLAVLNESYRAEFGRDMCVTDGYRSYAAQQSLKARKPGLAARPGTSEHGWGLAVDLCGGVESAGPAYSWLRENAPEHGWDNPAWARRGGGGPYEPWHWEYVAGQW
ncbi:M15 family metallopeptidase [Aquipuribacter sp. SD81]|uniref:M15 family metallopeptidase n=1 Tax=Aquipuribacter sp. SD81 TaxID=3127703 RepID=UPI0030181DF5